MPGLVGIAGVRSSEQQERNDAVREMREAITHLPFHIAGALFSDHKVSASRCTTGVVNTESQPWTDNGVHVWADGEIFNAGTTNAARVIAANCAHRDGFSWLTDIDGIFAAVIYDSNTGEVHLVNDRYGLGHLAWTRVDSTGLAWASEVKAFLHIPGFRPDINPDALHSFCSRDHLSGRDGQLTGDDTWFKGVQMLAAGSVLTWRDGAIDVQQYWSWDSIRKMNGAVDEDELAEELGRLFLAAVERRCRGDLRVGVSLSGGLDSRAILAALPESCDPVPAITYGVSGCDDMEIGSTVAKVRRAQHRTIPMSADNWLARRMDGVWWTDGMINLYHMHCLIALPFQRDFFDINMNGFFGDVVLGNSRPGDTSAPDFTLFVDRMRRFTAEGGRLESMYSPFTRLPFLDNRLVEFAMAIPERLRANSHIYRKMLLRTFPAYYKTIPWETTRVPIGASRLRVRATAFVFKVENRLRKESARWLGTQFTSPHNIVDYPNWLRADYGRAVFERILFARDAIYPDFISADQVQKDWTDLLGGRQEIHATRHADLLCRYVTLEVWLQKLYGDQNDFGLQERAG